MPAQHHVAVTAGVALSAAAAVPAHRDPVTDLPALDALGQPGAGPALGDLNGAQHDGGE
ncbi:hypothetical protein GGE06_005285 [Streptomyces sp. SFB5A]|uniref:Uncharacterized protein n=1 Tax=Streptomyces nymphaeiformis TaxID=2663842 RepID=A0A7W7U3J0_9ACTN|nr:hypothetical protein [Streptomyces nymphaeiformis]